MSKLLKTLVVTPQLDEHVVWEEFALPEIKHLPQNVRSICEYGFTEMLNNVVDHSESSEATVGIEYTTDRVVMTVIDKGIGIFEKIKREFNLDDDYQAIVELSKGKLTTDPSKHTGEGIFFREPGTLITMTIDPRSTRTSKEVFDRFASAEGDFTLDSTVLSISLARQGDSLVSRSKAKQLLSRLGRFKSVFFDFKGVESVGPAFADEIFRVFQSAHPEISLVPVNANEDVMKMILRAKSPYQATPESGAK